MNIKKGSIVQLSPGVKSANGKRILEYLIGSNINMYVMDINGNNVTVGIDNHEVATVKSSDLILVKL